MDNDKCNYDISLEKNIVGDKTEILSSPVLHQSSSNEIDFPAKRVNGVRSSIDRNADKDDKDGDTSSNDLTLFEILQKDSTNCVEEGEKLKLLPKNGKKRFPYHQCYDSESSLISNTNKEETNGDFLDIDRLISSYSVKSKIKRLSKCNTKNNTELLSTDKTKSEKGKESLSPPITSLEYSSNLFDSLAPKSYCNDNDNDDDDDDVTLLNDFVGKKIDTGKMDDLPSTSHDVKQSEDFYSNGYSSLNDNTFDGDIDVGEEIRSATRRCFPAGSSRSRNEQDSNLHTTRRPIRRGSSMFGRSYKDLLQRGVEVEGTGYVSSAVKKFLYGVGSHENKICIKVETDNDDCYSDEEDSRPLNSFKQNLCRIRNKKPKKKMSASSAVSPNGACKSKLSKPATAIDQRYRLEEFEYYFLNQDDNVLDCCDNVVDCNAANEFFAKDDEDRAICRSCMLCGCYDDELTCYQYCPNLVLCSVCSDPYENWIIEPWKYSFFKCKNKQNGLLCVAFNKSDCFVCWFWKCVNFVRRENVRHWYRQAREYHFSSNFWNSINMAIADDSVEALNTSAESLFPCDFTIKNGCVGDVENGSGRAENASTSVLILEQQQLENTGFQENEFFDSPKNDGPRIRYVSRRHSVLTGLNKPKNSSPCKEQKRKFWLSALPKKLKKALVNDRYEAVSSKRNKMVLHLKKQSNVNFSDASVSDESISASSNKSVTCKKTPPDHATSSGGGTVAICNREKRAKLQRCGVCRGCTAENCGICQSCRDMPKYGGSGTLKTCCRKRQCVVILTRRDTKKQKKRRFNVEELEELLNHSDKDSPKMAENDQEQEDDEYLSEEKSHLDERSVSVEVIDPLDDDDDDVICVDQGVEEVDDLVDQNRDSASKNGNLFDQDFLRL